MLLQMSEEGSKPVSAHSKYTLFLHSVSFSPPSPFTMFHYVLSLSSSLLLPPSSPFPLIPFILFNQAIPFRRLSPPPLPPWSHPHPSI